MKTKIAFIKIGGMTTGGTEKFLQVIAAYLPKEKFEIDYYYSDPPIVKKSDYYNPQTKSDINRLKFLEDHQVNVIKFYLDYVDLVTYTHNWVNTDFWDKFDENKYDIIQTGRAGHPEYPFYKIKKTPIVDSLHLSGMVDNQYNVSRVMHICEWNADKWIKKGGDKKRVVLVSHPMDIQFNGGNLREELKMQDKFIYGFHQRNDDSIYSDIPLKAYKMIESSNTVFILLGGSKKYQIQAKELALKNIIFLDHTGDAQYIYKFLNSLDVYAHGRKDGEVNSTAMAEAMYFGLPIVSHYSSINNGHVECIGNAGQVVSTTREYADEMIKLFENKEYYNLRKSEAKKQYLNKYKLEGQMENIINIYKDVIKNPFPNKISRYILHIINMFIKRIIVNKYTYLYLRKLQKIIRK